MATSDDVDVAGPTKEARQEAELYAEADPTYTELMLTYVELGELLDSGRADADYVAGCRELVDRLMALDRVLEAEYQERLAVRYARETTWGER